MNTDADRTKRLKARQMRYKKPIVKDLNLSTIQEELWNIQEECDNVKWYYDTDEDTLLNALDGDEDEAYEFKMMFADLCAECEQMSEDLNEEWVPECFDIFFVSAGAGVRVGIAEWIQKKDAAIKLLRGFIILRNMSTDVMDIRLHSVRMRNHLINGVLPSTCQRKRREYF